MPDRSINWGSSEADATYQTGDGDPAGGGNFVVVEDTDAGTVLLEWDETAEEWVSRGPVNLDGNDVANAGSVDAASVSTDEASITNFGGFADIILKRLGDNDYATIDGGTGGAILYEGSDPGAIIQSALDDRNGEQTTLAIEPHGEGAGINFQSGVDISVSSLSVIGAGKNKTTLQQQNNTGITLFTADTSNIPDGNAAILEFINIKLYGNNGDNTTGTALDVIDYPEVNFYNSEVNLWPDQGVRLAPSTAFEWNGFYNSWVLAGPNSNGGIVFSDANGANIEEFIVNGCILKGEPGAPAIATDAGLSDLTISGSRLKGADVIDLDGSGRHIIDGCAASRIDGDYTIRIGNSRNTNQTKITDSIFAGSSVTNHIVTAANASDFQIEGNRMFGQSGDAIAGAGLSNAGNATVRNNTGFQTEEEAVETVTSGSTQVTGISHNCDMNPEVRDFSVNFAGDPGDASACWVSSPSLNLFDLNVDADPGQDVDIRWRVEVYTP